MRAGIDKAEFIKKMPNFDFYGKNSEISILIRKKTVNISLEVDFVLFSGAT